MSDKVRVTALLGVVALLAAACGTASSASPTTMSAGQPGASPTQVEVAISNFAYSPQSLTVQVGTTVNWTNQDSARHTVASDAGDWDSGQLAQGQSWSHPFNEVGTFAYHCADHPSMTGAIQVTQ